MNQIRCITVEVFRDSYFTMDCSNNGVSNRFRQLLVACPDGPDVFDADVSTPLNFCHIRKRHLFGNDVYDLCPAAVDDHGCIVDRGGKWYMFGGNFAHTSDSRFSDLVRGVYGAIAIHDRVE